MSTIKDVARYARVSTATVSNVINGTRRVRAETRDRVLRAIEELGYSQNSAARQLAVGRSQLVGLIISDIENPFFPEVTKAFQDQALLHEMDTIVMNTNYDPHRTYTCVKRVSGLRVPGVAILTTEMERSLMEYLATNEIRAVYLDLGHVDRITSNIELDYVHGIQEAVEHLRELGHEEIAFIGGPPDFVSARKRKEAFLEHGGRLGRIIESDFTVQGGYYACSKLLSGQKPSAIIAANDMMAIGALHCAYDMRVKVPQELSVIGFDNIYFSQFTNPSLTTIAVPRQQLGRVAFETLWELIAQEETQGKEVPIKTHLVVRGSTARPAAPGVSR